MQTGQTRPVTTNTGRRLQQQGQQTALHAAVSQTADLMVFMRTCSLAISQFMAIKSSQAQAAPAAAGAADRSACCCLPGGSRSRPAGGVPHTKPSSGLLELRHCTQACSRCPAGVPKIRMLARGRLSQFTLQWRAHRTSLHNSSNTSPAVRPGLLVALS